MACIAVIGAGGFVGGALLGALRDAGGDCIGLRRADPLPTDPVDIVVDCNGEGRRFWSNQNPDESYRRSVATVEDRLHQLNAGIYVYVSTVDVYGEGCARPATSTEDTAIDVEALDTYGRHKFMAECMVLDKAPRPLVLRCATLIGPGLRKNPVYDLMHDASLRMTADSTLSLVHTETLSRAVQVLLEASQQGVYNIAASQPMTVPAVRDMVARARGVDPDAMPEHAERITTTYDLNVEKISAWIDMPTSEAALAAFLERDATA